MKYFLAVLFFVPLLADSQNLLQSTGNVGIGTIDPKSKLHVLDNGRDYYVNRMISGATEDGQGINYLLLHKIYTNTLLSDYYVMGKLTAVRGATWLWNRKWTVEVNTSSAYNANRGSIITYNEPASLVTLSYAGESYLAVQINNASTLGNFSFTGYAKNEFLTLVFDQDVTDVQSFSSLDPLTIQGTVGIGTTKPMEKLSVNGTVLAKKVRVSQAAADWPDYVFDSSYQLPSLESVSSFIQLNKHLPEMPSASVVEKEGHDVGEVQKLLLKKMEEMTLYMLQLKEENEKMKTRICELESLSKQKYAVEK